MTVPCLMGLKCPHCIDDALGAPNCCHPHTPKSMYEERWEQTARPCREVERCPLVDGRSGLGYILRIPDMYGPEEWQRVMAMIRVAVHRCERADSDTDAWREDVAAGMFRRWMELADGRDAE